MDYRAGVARPRLERKVRGSSPFNPTMSKNVRQGDNDEFAKKVIGLKLADAKLIYDDIRIRVADGHSLLGTADFHAFRMNVEVRNGIIVKVLGYG